MIKVYIASPYTNGDVGLNVNRQINCANTLIGLGYAPYVPLLSHYLNMKMLQPYNKWLELDLEWLELCDCLLRLYGHSKGADLEVVEMHKKNKPVFYNLNELNKYYKEKERTKISKI